VSIGTCYGRHPRLGKVSAWNELEIAFLIWLRRSDRLFRPNWEISTNRKLLSRKPMKYRTPSLE
jgi:hypothetical protein